LRRIPRLDELDGAVVNVDCSAIRTRRFCDARHRILAPANSVDTTSSSASTISLMNFRRCSGRSRAWREPVSETQRASREDFRTCRSSQSTRDRARFRPTLFTSNIALTAAGTCKCTSPMSRITFEPPRLSTVKRAPRHLRLLPRPRVPMLPEALSTACVPQAHKIAWSERGSWNSRRRPHEISRMTSGVIARRRMTYTNVNKVIWRRPRDDQALHRVAPRFREMKELALLLMPPHTSTVPSI